MQVDTFGAYVRAELEHWGREFALHRDIDYLGHHSKNMLQVLIEHKGDMPGRAQGYKPQETDVRAQRIEDCVARIGRYNLLRSCVLRGYYCGRGRRSVERLDIAQELFRRAARDPAYRLPRQRFFAEEEIGRAELRGFLSGLAQVA